MSKSGETTQAQVSSYFRKYGAMVLRRALILLGNREDAEDAVQEVFVRAFCRMEQFEQRSEVSTWLYKITTNHCLDVLRKRKLRASKTAAGFGASDGRLAGAPNVTELIVLRQLLSEADEREARAAVCVYIDDMSHEEAAIVLGVSRRTVGNLLERFNRWARSRLGEDARLEQTFAGKEEQR